MQKLTGLWMAKLNDANAWYHIYPFTKSSITKKIYVVRHRLPQKEVPDAIFYVSGTGNLIISMLKYVITGIDVIRRHHIDYLVTFNPVPWGSIAWIIAKIFRKPIIVGFIGDDFNKHLKGSWYGKILLNMIKKSELILVTGSNMKEYLLTNGVTSTPIVIYPHCVPPEWFEYAVDETSITSKYDLITVCQLDRGKRIEDIISALYLLHKKGHRLNFCIVGDGQERRNLEKEVCRRGLQKYVYFVGYQNDVTRFLCRARVYVQASESEGLSLSLIEALALGLPVITTVAGSEEDHIINGVNGYFFPIGDVERLSNLIEELLLDPTRYLRIKREAIKRRDKYRIENAIEVCNKILSMLIKKRDHHRK